HRAISSRPIRRANLVIESLGGWLLPDQSAPRLTSPAHAHVTCEALEERVCPAVTRVWTGAGGNDLASTASNWAGNAKPEAGDSLVFKADNAKVCRIDQDFTGTLGNITIEVGHKGIVVDRNLTVTNSLSAAAGKVEVSKDVTLSVRHLN